MDKDRAAAFWVEVHMDARGTDLSAEVAELEARVYSRAGNAEPVVDFIDPATGEIVRATPSQLRLRALRERQAAGIDAQDGAVQPLVAESAGTESGSLGSTGAPRRRFVGPIVVGVAVAAGIVTALVVTTIQAPIDRGVATVASAESIPSRFFPERLFDLPSVFDIPAPDPGDQFVAGSIQNISGTSESDQGFGVFLGRESDSGLYCLIVNSEVDVNVATCATADAVARQGLRVESPVTVRSFVASDAPYGDTMLTATLTNSGAFSMNFPPIDLGDIAAPPTTGTTLQEWSSGPSDAELNAEIDAHGESLIVALACVGEGSVTVDTDGYAYLFACAEGTIKHFQNQDAIAHGAVGVTITPTGNVTWGLTIASKPLTEPDDLS